MRQTFSAHECVRIGGDFSFAMSSEGTSSIIELQPCFLLLAHLALIALASQADHVSAFICSHSLVVYFLPADPAMKLFLLLLNFQVTQLLQG